MITQALYDKLNYLATLPRITTSDAKELQAAIQMYINPKYAVCLRCGQQLKHGQKIILNYLSKVEVIERISGTNNTEPLIEETVPRPEVDMVEAQQQGCSKCGRRKKNKS